MKKIVEFLSSRGMYLMLGGFLLALSGVIILMISKSYFWGQMVQNIAITASIAGFSIYVVGRIFVAMQRKNLKKNNPSSNSPKDDL